MNITEYAENLFNLAYSQEMIDFITNLGDISSDEWRMKLLPYEDITSLYSIKVLTSSS